MIRTLTRIHDDAQAKRYGDEGLWPNLPLHELVDRWSSETPQHRPAVSDGNRSFTYCELGQASRRAAAALHDLGLGPERVLSVYGPNSALIPVLHMAASRIGAAMLTMPSMWREHEVVPVVATTESAVLVVSDDHPDTDSGKLAATVRESSAHPLTVISIAELLARMNAAEPARDDDPRFSPDPDRVSMILCSSGTTGVPKLSALSANNLACQMLNQVAPASALTSDEIMAALAPVNTGSTGYFYGVLAPLLIGAASRILSKWSAESAAEFIAENGCTAATTVPTQVALLLEHLAARPALDIRLKALFSSGAAMTAPVAQRAIDRLGCEVFPIYGSSESTIPTMVRHDDPMGKRLHTVGRAAPGQEVLVVDATGCAVPDGVVGEVTWRGPNNSYGFFNQPSLEAAAWDADGFFHSGDAGVIDSDGYLSIVGRYKDMILRGGHNVFPLEIESALLSHPAVADVALVGITDEVFGERVCAVVVASAGHQVPDVAEFAAFLADRAMAKYKFPEYVVDVEELPRSASSKLDKRRIKQVAEAALSIS
ncbi:class I adenylate-forming enzyme family protein [Rhodococcus koreensis]